MDPNAMQVFAFCILNTVHTPLLQPRCRYSLTQKRAPKTLTDIYSFFLNFYPSPHSDRTLACLKVALAYATLTIESSKVLLIQDKYSILQVCTLA